MDNKVVENVAIQKQRGRPKGIEDEFLRNTRDFLVRILESTWSEVGWNLRTIKIAQDVPRSFRLWKSEQDLSPLVRVLLRSIDPEKEMLSLGMLRRHHRKLIASLLVAEQHQRECREFLDQADQATQIASKAQDKLVRKLRKKRARALAAARVRYERLDGERKSIEKDLRVAESQFAQAEIVKFCKKDRDNKDRYKKNPLKTANALAGLPHIGCRRSSIRCAKWECANAGSQEYEVFKAIRRIVNSWNLGTDLMRHARRRLEPRRHSASRAIMELREKWYYLQPSIKIAMKKRCSLEEMPFKITREYNRRKSLRTSVDRLLEQAERIVPRAKLNKRK